MVDLTFEQDVFHHVGYRTGLNKAISIIDAENNNKLNGIGRFE